MVRDSRTRLRWYKQKDGTIISEPVLAGSSIIKVFIYPKTFTLEIRDANEKYLYGAGKAKTLTLLKALAKKKLIECHAKFFDEVRLA